jgi:hypothetical protein
MISKEEQDRQVKKKELDVVLRAQKEVEKKIRADRKETLDGMIIPLPESSNPDLPKMARLDCPGSHQEVFEAMKKLKK